MPKALTKTKKKSVEKVHSTLEEFLVNGMKMSGPYQPVIIKCLLQNDGVATLEQIAKDLAANDIQAIDYYKEKLKVHPKQVLKSHKIAILKNNEYRFIDEIKPSLEDVKKLILIAEKKLDEFYSKNPTSDFAKNGWGQLRVRLISDHPYCALCGAKPDGETVLDIDHIKPVSKGGTDQADNLQVLCHRCNRAKGNELIKSAKESHEAYKSPKKGCAFCEIDKNRIVYEDEYIYEVKDAYPVTDGHSLIIPKRHVSDASELTDYELFMILRRMKESTKQLKKEYPLIKGFNLGFNIGKEAGQTVFHAHFHIIPRTSGDVVDPAGGIRNIIPNKGKYKK